jgi:hypothetical protein
MQVTLISVAVCLPIHYDIHEHAVMLLKVWHQGLTRLGLGISGAAKSSSKRREHHEYISRCCRALPCNKKASVKVPLTSLVCHSHKKRVVKSELTSASIPARKFAVKFCSAQFRSYLPAKIASVNIYGLVMPNT